jgi:imidazole glycerol-phosphate synthase subunit HisH
MLAILDYKAGNQTSVRRALDHLGIPCAITADPDTLRQASGVIFPGVGAAGQAMDELTSTGLDAVLRDIVRSGKPLLGICVGCQVLLDYSAENDTQALGIVPGECAMFNHALTEEDGEPIRVPHMGWNSVKLVKDCPLFEGIDPSSEFYFVHSYYPVPSTEFVLGTTFYGMDFCSLHGRTGLWAVQFHPEKSGHPGLQLLSNFATYCGEASNAQ